MTVISALQWIVSAVFLVLAGIVLYRISLMDLKGLICELTPNGQGGKASLSRFQFLLFTFVVAGVYLTLCLKCGEFVNIPGSALGLIGISSGSYVVSKSIPNK